MKPRPSPRTLATVVATALALAAAPGSASPFEEGRREGEESRTKVERGSWLERAAHRVWHGDAGKAAPGGEAEHGALGRRGHEEAHGREVAPPERAVELRPSERRFTEARELPREKWGTVRVYRGTTRPERLQVSRSMRGVAEAEVPRGDRHFLGWHEAAEHAGAGHKDGVSVTTDLGTAKLFATGGGGVVVYDIPEQVFAELPHGDRTQAERVFKFSIPEEYAVGVLEVARKPAPVSTRALGTGDLVLRRATAP